MENKINSLQQSLTLGLACILAVTLAANGIQALLGRAAFAWWHLFTLAFLVAMYALSLTARQRARIAVLFRLFKKRAAQSVALPFSNIHRSATAARPAFFNRPQTEP